MVNLTSFDIRFSPSVQLERSKRHRHSRWVMLQNVEPASFRTSSGKRRRNTSFPSVPCVPTLFFMVRLIRRKMTPKFSKKDAEYYIRILYRGGGNDELVKTEKITRSVSKPPSLADFRMSILAKSDAREVSNIMATLKARLTLSPRKSIKRRTKPIPYIKLDQNSKSDLVIVMGTLLKVDGVKNLIKDFANTVHRHKNGRVVFVNHIQLARSV